MAAEILSFANDALNAIFANKGDASFRNLTQALYPTLDSARKTKGQP